MNMFFAFVCVCLHEYKLYQMMSLMPNATRGGEVDRLTIIKNRRLNDLFAISDIHVPPPSCSQLTITHACTQRQRDCFYYKILQTSRVGLHPRRYSEYTMEFKMILSPKHTKGLCVHSNKDKYPEMGAFGDWLMGKFGNVGPHLNTSGKPKIVVVFM